MATRYVRGENMENIKIIKKYENIVEQKMGFLVEYYRNVKTGEDARMLCALWQKYQRIMTAYKTYPGEAFEQITAQFLTRAVKCKERIDVLNLAVEFYDEKYGFIFELVDSYESNNLEVNKSLESTQKPVQKQLKQNKQAKM